MGTFRYSIEVGDPQGQRFEQVDALVDTGATYTTLPASVLQGLGVEPLRRSTFVLADGRRVERAVGQTWVRVDGQSAVRLVVFGEEGGDPLLGADTLEGLLLAVDPVGHRLVPTEGLLMVMHSRVRASAASRRRASTPLMRGHE